MNIPVGRENAISRTMLSVQTGLPDREVRRKIQALRQEGRVIINDGDGRGYYETDDLDVIYKEYQKERGRALAILARLKHMRQILKSEGRL